eukprot:131970-Hanusia_phi.AAC.1
MVEVAAEEGEEEGEPALLPDEQLLVLRIGGQVLQRRTAVDLHAPVVCEPLHGVEDGVDAEGGGEDSLDLPAPRQIAQRGERVQEHFGGGRVGPHAGEDRLHRPAACDDRVDDVHDGCRNAAVAVPRHVDQGRAPLDLDALARAPRCHGLDHELDPPVETHVRLALLVHRDVPDQSAAQQQQLLLLPHPPDRLRQPREHRGLHGEGAAAGGQEEEESRGVAADPRGLVEGDERRKQRLDQELHAQETAGVELGEGLEEAAAQRVQALAVLVVAHGCRHQLGAEGRRELIHLRGDVQGSRRGGGGRGGTRRGRRHDEAAEAATGLLLHSRISEVERHLLEDRLHVLLARRLLDQLQRLVVRHYRCVRQTHVLCSLRPRHLTQRSQHQPAHPLAPLHASLQLVQHLVGCAGLQQGGVLGALAVLPGPREPGVQGSEGAGDLLLEPQSRAPRVCQTLLRLPVAHEASEVAGEGGELASELDPRGDGSAADSAAREGGGGAEVVAAEAVSAVKRVRSRPLHADAALEDLLKVRDFLPQQQVLLALQLRKLQKLKLPRLRLLDLRPLRLDLQHEILALGFVVPQTGIQVLDDLLVPARHSSSSTHRVALTNSTACCDISQPSHLSLALSTHERERERES